MASPSLALGAFLHSVRSSSLRRILKTLTSRSLLLWLRILGKLRKVWSWYFRTSFNGGKKTEEITGRHSSTRTLRKREEYGVVCASWVPGGLGESSRRLSMSESVIGQEPIELAETGIGRSQSLSYHPSSSSAQSISIQVGSPDSPRELTIRRSSTPVSWTHPRAAATQFTGSSLHSRSRSPSPSRSLFHRRRSRHDTPERLDIDTSRPPAMVQDSSGSPETWVPVHIQPPSRVGSPEELNSSTDSLSSIRLHGPSVYGTQGSAHHSTGSIRSGFSTPQSSQGSQHSVTNPGPYASSVSIQIPTSGTQPRSEERLWRPMHSDQVSRYVKQGDVPKRESRFHLRPMDVDLPHSYRLNQDLGDWVPITHPGGALYFYHKSWRIFTDVYMYDPDLREEVYEFAKLLRNEISELVLPFPTSNYDLVLDIVETKDKKTIWQYYFVDHDKKTLFWLEDYDMSSLLYEVPGLREPGHIKHRLESLYWVHWSLYPVGYQGREFPGDAPKELLGVLLSSSIDSLTSKVSTAPYSVADMETMRDIIKEAQDLGHDNAHAISSVARLLSIFAHWKFVHFHGQKTSRQDRSKSIYADDGHKHERMRPFRILSLVLFFYPDIYLRELKKVWMDGIFYEIGWRDFVVMLESEWEEFILNSTVMLAANVSFLSVPGVIPNQANGWTKPSTAQVASCMSLVFSIGGIISGLLLIRSTHTAGQGASTTWDYSDNKNDLEPSATMYSLPFGLLMWSVCMFFIALLLITCSKTRKEIRVPVGVAVGLVCLIIFLCIARLWKQSLSVGDSGDIIDVHPIEGE